VQTLKTAGTTLKSMGILSAAHTTAMLDFSGDSEDKLTHVAVFVRGLEGEQVNPLRGFMVGPDAHVQLPPPRA